jgi:hypothetical protein
MKLIKRKHDPHVGPQYGKTQARKYLGPIANEINTVMKQLGLNKGVSIKEREGMWCIGPYQTRYTSGGYSNAVSLANVLIEAWPSDDNCPAFFLYYKKGSEWDMDPDPYNEMEVLNRWLVELREAIDTEMDLCFADARHELNRALGWKFKDED